MKIFSYLILTVLTTHLVIALNTKAQAAQTPILRYEIDNKKYQIEFFASDNLKDFYTINDDNFLQSKSIVDGRDNWSYELANSPSEIVADDAFIYLSVSNAETDGSRTTVVRALSKKTGVPVWQTEKHAFSRKIQWKNKTNDERSVPKTFLFFQKEIDLVLVDSEGVVVLIDRKSGATKWKVSIKSQITARPVISGDALILPGDDLRLHFFDLNDGRILKTHNLRGRVSALYADERQIIVGDQKGIVESLDSTNASAQWSFKTGGEISGIAALSDGFLISSFDNFAYRVARSNGDLAWKKRLFNRLREKPLINSSQSIAALIDGRRAVFLDLNAKGAILSQIELSENEFFVDAPILLKDLYIFNTGRRTFVYSFNKCPSRD